MTLAQEKESCNPNVLTDVFDLPSTGRMIAIDPGTKRCGIAVCDELRITVRPLKFLLRSNWKKLLSNIITIVAEFDAKAVVMGLPIESDGGESPMSIDARRLARNLALSINVPVFLQDERVSSYEAKRRLWLQSVSLEDTRSRVDSEAAAIILSDVLDRLSGGKGHGQL